MACVCKGFLDLVNRRLVSRLVTSADSRRSPLNASLDSTVNRRLVSRLPRPARTSIYLAYSFLPSATHLSFCSYDFEPYLEPGFVEIILNIKKSNFFVLKRSMLLMQWVCPAGFEGVRL